MQPSGLLVAGIEAPLEADLDRYAGRLDLAGDGDGAGEVIRHRLLAERRDATRDAGSDELRVGIRGGSDDQRVSARERVIDLRALRAPIASASSIVSVGLGVGDGQHDIGPLRQQPGVEAPDAARAKKADAERGAVTR